VDRGPPLIMEKNGGLNNTTSYTGMMPGEKLGILILSNRGSNNAGARSVRTRTEACRV
jgi:hypothetical protein